MNADETVNPGAESAQGSEGTCCGIHSAAEAVERAKAELRKAQALYEDVKRRTAERVDAVRKTTVGDMLDCTLNTVRKHPGVGLTLAAAAGFFLGRLFRK
jgi:ElaB/YqjD/DUF883 family membrane-anchored ribosome-binding protein